MDNSGPAFPTSSSRDGPFGGLTKREYFAAHCPACVTTFTHNDLVQLTGVAEYTHSQVMDIVCMAQYVYADKMLTIGAQVDEPNR